MRLTNCFVSICRLCHVQRVTCCRSHTLFFCTHTVFVFRKKTKRVYVWIAAASWNANFFIPSLCLMNGQTNEWHQLKTNCSIEKQQPILNSVLKNNNNWESVEVFKTKKMVKEMIENCKRRQKWNRTKKKSKLRADL